MTDSSAANDSSKPETIDGPGRPPAPARGGSTGKINSHVQQQQQQPKQPQPPRNHHHQRSNSADLAQAFHRQQQMMMMHQAGGSSGSLGASSNGGFPYGGGAMYGGGGVMPMPPPPPPHGYYYAYGGGAPPPHYNHMMAPPEYMPQGSAAQGTSPQPQDSRARSWSGDAAMFMDRQQQQMRWMSAMQQQQQQQAPSPLNFGIPSYGSQSSGGGMSTPRSSRHRRSHSSSSAGGGSNGGSNAPFSPRTEFMKLAGGVGAQGSPRGSVSPSARYGGYTAGAGGMNAYSPLMQAPMTAVPPPPPPPQAYETMYDAFDSSSGAAAPTAPSPYMSPEKRVYGSTTGSGSGRASPFATPEKMMYGANSLATSSIGSSGGEAVYLAQRARGIASGGGSSSGPSSSRKRHMRQQSVQLFMQEVKGVEQPPACRDVFFLLFFVFHLFGMVLLFNIYSYEALEHPNAIHGKGLTVNYNNLLIIAGCSGAFAMVVSTTMLGVMSYFASNFVQVALIVAIALSFVWGTLGIGLSPKNLVPITGIVALALSVAYAVVVWDRLPFSTANLRTALMAVRSYPGTIVMTLVSQVLGLGWSIYYAVICCGVYDAIQDGRIAVSHRLQVVIYVLLGISYYWTIQVFLNAVQVATAAVVGQWWYQSDETVQKSTFKTIFYSMGSICFGSLFVGPVKVIRQFSVFFRPSSDEASLLLFHGCLHCIQTCITECVEGLAERFNPWGFAYVGLYGYAFPEAASLATELFAKRGWTTIVSDDLVSNVLLMTSVVVGGVTGCFAFLLSGLERLHVTSLDTPGVVSFFVGLVLGLVLTSILFGAINGSVNAVIILFATSPVDFERNHHDLSHEMRSAWREVWPGAVDDVDIRLAMAGAGNGGGRNIMVGSSPMLGPMSGGVVPPPPPIVPEYAQVAERTPLILKDR